MDDIEEHRLSFGAVAQAYQQSRPSYPAEALAWAIGTAPGRVVDLGAGTGQLTRVALAAGFEVVPVEPDPAMRAALHAATPGTEAREGSAESIPLPDGYADAVVVGTAYHWFDKVRAHPEIARVLRPDGVFAPLRNDRDLSVDWVRRLDEIVQSARAHRTDEADFGPLFAPAEWATFRHAVTQTPQGLLDLIATRSWYLVATEDVRQRLRDQVTDLCATHPDLAGRESFALPYVTTVCRTVRR
ncbi:class I SAM-dependent methyltransferase [Catellatospora coxensis]|uniref:Putative methyltransferase n=1 Tax=Catellatospora coxensis TaxID=310354 RepID=A0A8J3KYX8_9ACTN|nr:class I SAM-dependent methyltransferase [Catellatospora coxensis]GIG08872.1 putative methyltransferase [Catellatospora coxensis]